MNLEDVYLEAMEASIENAEQWIKDAAVVLANNSLAHARALQNFAGEECAKALGCWLVAIGLLPSNHPDVEIGGRKSIFKSHHLKNKLSLLLASLPLLPEITPGAVIGVLIVAESAGKWGTDKRMERMYVDILEADNGYKISNPLKLEAGDVQAGLNLVNRQIQFFKRFVKEIDSTTIELLKDNLKDFFKNVEK